MYLDPRNQIQGGFGGVKRVDFGQREKRIADLKKQLDEGRVKIGRITKWTVRIAIPQLVHYETMIEISHRA